jgi:hypothetical protein
VTSAAHHPERRRHARAISNFLALLTAGKRQYTARVINLSMGGALLDCGRVQLPQSIRVGDRVSVHVSRRGAAEAVLIEGAAVLWSREGGGPPLLAVQFDEVSGECSAILEDLIREALVEKVCRDDASEKHRPLRRAPW